MFNKSSSSKTSANSADVSKKNTAARPSAARNPVPSILSRDLVITGEINTDGDVQIEGRLEGNIKAATVTVGEQGAINGNINADSVFVRGKITGNINADSVELAQTANVLADITQNNLTIENGAYFDGKCARRTTATMNQAGTATKPAAKKA